MDIRYITQCDCVICFASKPHRVDAMTRGLLIRRRRSARQNEGGRAGGLTKFDSINDVLVQFLVFHVPYAVLTGRVTKSSFGQIGNFRIRTSTGLRTRHSASQFNHRRRHHCDARKQSRSENWVRDALYPFLMLLADPFFATYDVC